MDSLCTKRIGEILVDKGICTEEDIVKALQVQKKVGGYLGTILLNLGLISEEDLLEALSEQFGVRVIQNISNQDYKLYIPSGINVELLEYYQIVPVEIGEKIFLLVNDPLNIDGINYVLSYLKVQDYEVALTYKDNIELILSSLQKENKEEQEISSEEIEKIKELALETPVIKLVNSIIREAVSKNVSDIHFEAFKNNFRVRFRLDGILRTVKELPNHLRLPIITRLKLMSGMDISESRLPQDGRINIKYSGEDIDIRASSFPTRFGESFVLRILKRSSIELSLDKLGFLYDHVSLTRKMSSKAYGMLLTTGPTGSGKTTTLYSILRELNNDQVKIVTVEDPVEYELEGINQVNVKQEIGLTFSTALKYFLRQDPDIIMVGEIRDPDTAEIASQAALTGHLVLSTLHTNDAIRAIDRLRDLKLPIFILKSTVIGIMAQRLVRTLCPFCSERITFDELMDTYPDLKETIKIVLDKEYFKFFSEVSPKKKVGCEKCNFTGYLGRTVISEVIEVNPEFWSLYDKSSFLTPRDIGTRSVLEDGIIKVLAGITSVEEVTRVAY
jgi:type II secretory ATPase GspE/PulE/Tfp pilus assembly ATPase PilB-like protein